MFKRQQPQQPIEQPLFETRVLGMWCRLYTDRVEIKSVTGVDTIPLSQVVGVEAGMSFGITTTGGRQYSVPVSTKKKELRQAILDARTKYLASMQPQSNTTPGNSIADEIAKLHTLWQQGIISEADFEQGKKKLLGI